MTVTLENTTVTVNRDDLHAAVTVVANAIPRRPALPILAAVVLDGDKVYAFDYETSIQVTVTGLKAPKTAVAGRLLLDTLKALPRKTAVTIDFDKDQVVVQGGGLSFTIPTLPVEDYPRVPELGLASGHQFYMGDFKRIVSVTIAAGTDFTLPTLTGVQFTPENGGLTVAATDRYRLAVAHVPNVDLPPMLVPAGILKLAAKVFKKEQYVLILTDAPRDTGETRVEFTAGDITIITRLMDGEFPKFRQLIPDTLDATYTTDIPRVALKETVRAVALMAERNTPVRLGFNEDHITVKAGSIGGETAGAASQVPCARDADPIEGAFNPGFLADACDFLTGDTISCHSTSATKPFLYRGADPDSVYLLMPVRLTG